MSFLYANPGHGNLFTHIKDANYTEETSSLFITGIGFGTAISQENNVPSGIKELWAKLDYYQRRLWSGYIVSFTGGDKTCGVIGNDGNSSQCRIMINGEQKFVYYPTKSIVHNYYVHIVSDAVEGVFEFYSSGELLYSFSGDVLGGADITKFSVGSANDRSGRVSNIIVADTKLGFTEDVITLPISVTSTNMTDNGDGTYSALNSGEYIKQTIDSAAIRQLCTASTVITGVCIAGRPGYYTGEGIDTMEAMNENTVLGESTLSPVEASITYGLRMNTPIGTFNGTYGWRAK